MAIQGHPLALGGLATHSNIQRIIKKDDEHYKN